MKITLAAAAIAGGLDRFTPTRWDELELGLRAAAAAARQPVHRQGTRRVAGK